MDTVKEFDFASVEATVSDPVIAQRDTCKADGCHNPPATYGGKGPRPKFCSEHKGKPSSSSSKPRAKKYGTDYTEGIAGILGLPAMVLGVVGAQTNNVALVADGVVIGHYAPGIASAVNELAQDRPEIAAALDKILKVGPYGALIGAMMPMVTQLMANHKLIKPGTMGTQSAEGVLGIPTESREGTPDA
jgi:hypothetical protein